MLEITIQELVFMLSEMLRGAMSVVGLEGSNLQKSVEVKATSQAFEVYMNDYAEWVIRGRKPGGKKVPIAAILDWIKRKRIVGRSARGRFITRTSLAFAIQTSLHQTGIRARNFLDPTLEGFVVEAIAHFEESISKELDTALAA